MDDDDLFHDLMRSLGVSPLRGGKSSKPPQAPAPDKPPPAPSAMRRRRPPPDKVAPPDEEDALFLAVMAMESKKSKAPDKDRATPDRSTGMRQIKPSKSRDAEPEAKLDLHGQSATEAVGSLERFVISATSQRLRMVLVVTGKGLRSERGVPVLKQTAERWLRMRGKNWVRAFSEAPRKLGGRGAYLLYLR